MGNPRVSLWFRISDKSYVKQEIPVIQNTKKPVQFVHEINQPANLDILQRRGDEGEDLHYLPNQKLPFSGYAASSYTNGQKEVLAQFKNGKLIFAQGWKFNGEPNISKVENGTGFIMETDDPEVGFYYENGIEIAYRGKKIQANLIIIFTGMEPSFPIMITG